LKPSSAGIQQDVLAAAISEIIWRAGDGEKALLCLPQPSTVHVTSSARFNEDGLTERVSSSYYIQFKYNSIITE